jgi:hypothetical protein
MRLRLFGIRRNAYELRKLIDRMPAIIKVSLRCWAVPLTGTEAKVR